MQTRADPYREHPAIPAILSVDGLLRVPLLAARLPDRCVVCNRSTETMRTKTIFYRPSRPDSLLALLVLLCTNWVAFLYLRPVIVDFALCVPHHRRRRRVLGGLLLGAVLCFVLAFTALVTGGRMLGLILLIPAAGFALVAQVLHPALRLKRVDQEYAWLRVAPSFLESFPSSMIGRRPLRDEADGGRNAGSRGP